MDPAKTYQVENGSIEAATYYPESGEAHWVQYRAGDKLIALDGGFTREQLEFFLTLMPKD